MILKSRIFKVNNTEFSDSLLGMLGSCPRITKKPKIKSGV